VAAVDGAKREKTGTNELKERRSDAPVGTTVGEKQTKA